MNYANITIVSDGHPETYWNTGTSELSSIAVDNSGNLHVVWEDATPGKWSYDANDYEIMYANYSVETGQWSNATVISDGYQGLYWNTGSSNWPSIAVDNTGNLYVVWYDITLGKWSYDANDYEIMYANYTVGVGWSNATVISDGYQGSYWNTGDSYGATIAVDNLRNIYVVWQDATPGSWKSGGSDYEIMCVNYSVATGKWSNMTVISDGYQGLYWNTGDNYGPSIAVDNLRNIYVVWQDATVGKWSYDANDYEIMYVNYSVATGKWSNMTVISDGYQGIYWNTELSAIPSIAVDNSGNLHVIWQDDTVGKWGVDREIMYADYSVATNQWSNATVISDGYQGIYWNLGDSKNPSIAVDKNSGNLHVVWQDDVYGDDEIMYVKYSVAANQWSNATVISDGCQGIYWNTGNTNNPSITVDNSGNIHVVWEDDTPGKWGADYEIMYTIIKSGGGGFIFYIGDDDDDNDKEPSVIPFGNYYLLFIVFGTIGLVICMKRNIKNN